MQLAVGGSRLLTGLNTGSGMTVDHHALDTTQAEGGGLPSSLLLAADAALRCTCYVALLLLTAAAAAAALCHAPVCMPSLLGWEGLQRLSMHIPAVHVSPAMDSPRSTMSPTNSLVMELMAMMSRPSTFCPASSSSSCGQGRDQHWQGRVKGVSARAGQGTSIGTEGQRG